MSNETVKNDLKASPNESFSQKTTTVPTSLFHSAKFWKHSSSRSRVMRMCHFWVQNGSFVLNKFFLVLTIVIFIEKIFKTFLQRIQSYEDVPFLGPKWSNWSKEKSFRKIIHIIFICRLALFIVQNFKNILPKDPELWGCTIFGPKMAHLLKWEFFQKTC